MRTLSLILFLALLSGCKHPPMNSGDSAARLKRFGDIIAKADRIVATNAATCIGVTVSGDESREVVRAVSSARLCGFSEESFSCYLRFYRGTNFLADVCLEGSRFVLLPRDIPHMEEVPGIGRASVTYDVFGCDDSGVLQHIYDVLSPPLLAPDRGSRLY